MQVLSSIAAKVLSPEFWMNFAAFILVISVLVVLHEFGHYIAAKGFGVRVETFSVGFGPRLFGKKVGDTDYRVSAIPLGGYVAMLGEEPGEDGGGGEDDLSAKPRWVRFIIFVMGAFLNLVLAYVLMVGVFVAGKREWAYRHRPVVIAGAQADSPAARAGLRQGDQVLRMQGKPLSTWQDFELETMINPDTTVELAVLRDGQEVLVPVEVESEEDYRTGYIGALPVLKLILREVTAESPASEAGLQVEDLIVEVAGVPINGRDHLGQVLQAGGGAPLVLTVERAGQTREVTVLPRREPGMDSPKIGVAYEPETVVVRYPLGRALVAGFQENVRLTGLLFSTLSKLVRGGLHIRSMSGPLDIAKFSGRAARMGAVPLLQFMAFISLNLGIFNLLPIPGLDGGLIFILLIEGTLRRDLSVKVKERLIQGGFAFLILLMVVVIYFDIAKNL